MYSDVVRKVRVFVVNDVITSEAMLEHVLGLDSWTSKRTLRNLSQNRDDKISKIDDGRANWKRNGL